MILRRVISLILTILILFSLYGCNNSKTNETEETTTTAIENYSGTINIWSIETNSEALKLVSDSFKKDYIGTEIKVEAVTEGNFAEKFDKAYKTGGTLPDVLLLQDSMIPFYIANYPEAYVNLTDVSNPIKNDIIQSKINDGATHNTKYIIPWNNNPVAMYYRTDIYAKYGVNIDEIITWEDFINAGKTILDKSGGITKTLPLDIKSINSTYEILLSQLGESSFDKDGKPTLNSPESLKIIKLIKGIKDSQINANVDFSGLINGLKNDSIASVPYNTSLANYLTTNIAEQSGKWAIKKLPAFEAGGRNSSSSGGSSFLILNKSLNKKLSKEFVKYSASNSKILTSVFLKNGLFPSFIPAYSEAVFSDKSEYFKGQNIWKFFSEISRDVQPINYSISFGSIESLLEKMEENIILNKDITPEALLKSINDTQLEAENQWLKESIQSANKSKN